MNFLKYILLLLALPCHAALQQTSWTTNAPNGTVLSANGSITLAPGATLAATSLQSGATATNISLVLSNNASAKFPMLTIQAPLIAGNDVATNNLITIVISNKIVGAMMYGSVGKLAKNAFPNMPLEDDTTGWAFWGLDDINGGSTLAAFPSLILTGYGDAIVPSAEVGLINNDKSYFGLGINIGGNATFNSDGSFQFLGNTIFGDTDGNFHANGEGSFVSIVANTLTGNGAGLTGITAYSVDGSTIVTNNSPTAYALNGGVFTNLQSLTLTNKTGVLTSGLTYTAPTTGFILFSVQTTNGNFVTFSNVTRSMAFKFGAITALATNFYSASFPVKRGDVVCVTNGQNGAANINFINSEFDSLQ